MKSTFIGITILVLILVSMIAPPATAEQGSHSAEIGFGMIFGETILDSRFEIQDDIWAWRGRQWRGRLTGQKLYPALSFLILSSRERNSSYFSDRTSKSPVVLSSSTSLTIFSMVSR